MRVYARIYARMNIRTHDHDQHTTGHTNGTQDTTGKGAATSAQIKFAYIIGMIAKNEKK